MSLPLEIKLSSISATPRGNSSSSPPNLSPSSLLNNNAVLSSSSVQHLTLSRLFWIWWTHRVCSRDRVERHYSFLVTMLILSSLLFAAIKLEGSILRWSVRQQMQHCRRAKVRYSAFTICLCISFFLSLNRGSPLCTCWSLAILCVTLLNVYAEIRDRSSLFEFTRLLQFLLTMLSVLIYYDGSNVVNRWRFDLRGEGMLYDSILLKMDEFLLGWLYPRGQLSLYLDTQPDFGVTTPIGMMYAELFQILYISYYFWGNAIGIYLAYQYFYYCVWKKNKGMKKRMQWRRIQMFVSAWVGAFVLNHLINLMFPAMSPRIYIASSFQNDLKGMWLLSGLRSAVTNAAAKTYSAFPSGHCGLSILAAILAFRIGLHRVYCYCVLLTTILIVLATQVLRYHYFVDFLFSIVCVAFGTWLGNFHTKEGYQRSLVKFGLEDHDEDGKPMLGSSPSTNGVEGVPLLSSSNGGSGSANNSNGMSSSASRTKLSSILSPSSSHNEPDLELGGDTDVEAAASSRNTPPLTLSSQVFGNTMTRSNSHSHIAANASSSASTLASPSLLPTVQETETAKGV